MFSELTWVGVAFLGLGVLVVGVPALWFIVRGARDRADAHDPFSLRHRGRSRFRRIDPGDDRT